MKTSLKYVFLLIVSVCYLQAAFEVNTGSVTNTWGDEYDTYIHADHSTIAHFDKADHAKTLPSLTPSTFNIQIPIGEVETSTSALDQIVSPPPKLFLEFHSLLI